MKTLIAVPAVLVLVVGAYLLGRAGREAPVAPAKPLPKSEQPQEVSTKQTVRFVITEREEGRGPDRLKEIQAELKKAVENRPAALNDLQNFLLSALGEGRLTAAQVLEMFRSESDIAVLDVLQGSLAASPEAADAPGVRQAFESIARGDAVAERRQAAIAFLGCAEDRSGGVRKGLMSLAEADGDLSLRLTALGALAGYAQRNPDQAPAVNAGLLELARPGPHGEEFRTQALSSVDARSADEGVVRRLSELLSDPSGAVRLASAERIAESPPAFRSTAVASLEAALMREPVAEAKPALLVQLVKAGRAESLAALERIAASEPRVRTDALDYLSILRAGYVDWSDIEAEKSKRGTK